jgi:curved DNA-binding protein CbpA
MSDPYSVLGLAPGAAQADIRRAYLDLVRAHPPEREPEMFKRVRAAYEQLCTADAQAETDLFLLQAPPAWQPPRTVPTFDVAFHPEDVLTALQAWGDLGCTDFSADFREVTL